MSNILITEDDESIRLALRKSLARAGYDVSEAANGAEGAAIYNGSVPDLIITDILMPDQDGVEALLTFGRSYPTSKLLSSPAMLRNSCLLPAILGHI